MSSDGIVSSLTDRLTQTDQVLIPTSSEAGDELVNAAFGVQEPHPRRTDAVPDLIIVPVLGFDAFGNRIGYGGGYYDRTLQSLRARGNVHAIGVGYEEQECAKIPTHPLDEPLDLILTDKRVFIPSAKNEGIVV